MKNSVPTMRTTVLVLGVALAGSSGRADAAATGDWPCIQPRVAEMSLGQMWAGPAIENTTRWHEDQAVASTVSVLAARRTPLEEAAKTIEKFANEAGGEKNAKLTLLFTGVFERLNTERSRIIAGIERYARKQRALSERIKKTGETLADRKSGAEKPGESAATDLEQTLRWDTRIYEERNQALTYVCESPTIIEQRAFSLSREIQNYLD